MDTIETLRGMTTTLPCRFAENGDRNDIYSEDTATAESTNLYNGFTDVQSLVIAYPWESGKEYVIGDFVVYDNVKYICLDGHEASEENAPPNEDYWEETTESTGRPVLRGDINGLGYLCTDEFFYNMCGGIYEYDPVVADMINGYPKDAVLAWKDPSDGILKWVKCIKSDGDCKVDYRATGPDEVNWTCVSGEVQNAQDNAKLPGNLQNATFSFGETTTTESTEEVTATRTGMAYLFALREGQPTIYDSEAKIIISRDATQTTIPVKVDRRIRYFTSFMVSAGDRIKFYMTGRCPLSTTYSIKVLYP